MPDFGERPNGRKSISRLLLFLGGVEEVLSRLVESGRDPLGKPLFIGNVLPQMRAAWAEMPEHFRALRAGVGRLSDTKIRDHGFSPIQLNFKLQVVASWWRRFSENGGRRIALKLLGAIDTVLDSLIDATGLGGAIKEIKDAIAGAID